MEYHHLLLFIKELERLKNNTRTAWTSTGRQESIAEHSWRLAMFCMALEPHVQDIDMSRVLRMSLIHDLGEAYEGDVSAMIAEDPALKLHKEEDALRRLIAPLPESLQQTVMDLWREYTEGNTREAKLVKALDKIETIVQHNQGDNPPDFDYSFNLGYGKPLAAFDPVLQAIRDIVDGETVVHMNRNRT